MTDKPTIAPLGDFPDHAPTENSSLEELAAYALDKQNGILASDKKNGEDLWLMGQALEWAYKKTPYGEWEDWFKAQALKKTFVWQARTLHDRATLDEVRELGMTLALRKFKVLPEKKPQGATKAAGGKKNEDENGEAVPASDKKAEEQADTPQPSEDAEQPTEAGETSGEDEGGVSGEGGEGDTKASDDQADEEEKELKAFQENLRKLTPKTRAIAIQHTLEWLREELDGEEVDEELQQTFGLIAHLAEELKGLNCHDEQDS